MARSKKKQGVAATVLTVIAAIVIVILQQGQSGPAGGTAHAPGGGGSATVGGEAAVIEAFEDRRSDVHVEVDATVTKILPDDEDGDAHQRFLVRLPGFEYTVLISHNIDLAPRVPLRVGDSVRVKGEYEWSSLGGVIHWTHHNPNRNPRHPGGWVEHEGTRYQ